MAKLTITEFAKRLGVSVCTVNKALSGKPKVSATTRARVIAEAERLGYRPNRMAQVLARNPVRLAYLHPAHFESFFGAFEAGVEAGGERLVDQNVSVSSQGLDPAKWQKLLLPAVRRLLREGLSGLILAPITGVEYGGLWDLLAERRVPLVQLGLEVPGSPAALTVRQDTLLSGRMAAELLAQFPGPAALMIGSRAVGDHAEKLAGFEAEAARRGLAIAAVVEHHDDERLGCQLTRQLLAERPDVRSVYVATDNFHGICRALAEHGAGRLKVVATGLFPAIRQAMDEDLVHFALDQRMIEQGEMAVQQLHDLLSGHTPSTPRVLVPPLIAVRSNIDLLAARKPTPKRSPGDTSP
jgi:LacI family transcriptional regulator